jgi:hypothetical protein
VQYADYAIWQQRFLTGEILSNKIEFWKEKLNEVEPLLLPADYKRPAIQSIKGAIIRFNINPETTAAVHTLSRQQGTTLFMTLLAAFKVLLYRYTTRQTFALALVQQAGSSRRLKDLSVFLSIPWPAHHCQWDGCFTELLQQVKGATLEA